MERSRPDSSVVGWGHQHSPLPHCSARVTSPLLLTRMGCCSAVSLGEADLVWLERLLRRQRGGRERRRGRKRRWPLELDVDRVLVGLAGNLPLAWTPVSSSSQGESHWRQQGPAYAGCRLCMSEPSERSLRKSSRVPTLGRGRRYCRLVGWWVMRLLGRAQSEKRRREGPYYC